MGIWFEQIWQDFSSDPILSMEKGTILIWACIN